MAKVDELIRETIEKHGRIIFNGNGYSDEWVEEAKRRGLPVLPTTVDALPAYISDKVKKLFERHGVFSKTELEARYEIHLEDYIKTLNIEALTSLEMAKQEILPACLAYTDSIVGSVAAKDSLGIKASAQRALAAKLSDGCEALISAADALEAALANAPDESLLVTATYFKDEVIAAMNALRAAADTMETMVSKAYWPFPTYSDLLYRV